MSNVANAMHGNRLIDSRQDGVRNLLTCQKDLFELTLARQRRWNNHVNRVVE